MSFGHFSFHCSLVLDLYWGQRTEAISWYQMAVKIRMTLGTLFSPTYPLHDYSIFYITGKKQAVPKTNMHSYPKQVVID